MMPPAMDESHLPCRDGEPTRSAIRALAVASLLGLIVLGLAWDLWLAPHARAARCWR
jgi:uncharacterized membrane protein